MPTLTKHRNLQCFQHFFVFRVFAFLRKICPKLRPRRWSREASQRDVKNDPKMTSKSIKLASKSRLGGVSRSLEASRRHLVASCGVSWRLVASRRVVSWRLVASRGVSDAREAPGPGLKGLVPKIRGSPRRNLPLSSDTV